MSVAPYAGVVALDNFLEPTDTSDGLQGQVPKPLAGQQNYVLTGSGFVPAGNIFTSVGSTGYYGTFQDTTTATAASTTTDYLVSINTQDSSNGIILSSGSRITAVNAGLYNLEFSSQFANPNSSIANVSVWLRQNGVDLPSGAGTNGIPAKHGSFNGLQVIGWNYILQMAAGDYVELWWQSDVTGVQLITIPATINPDVPTSPSTSVSVIAVSQIGIGYYGETSSTSATIGLGSFTFTVSIPATSIAFTAGTRVRFAYTATPSNFMEGVITAFSGTTMAILVDTTGGSGTYASWNVSVAGNQSTSSIVVGSTGISGGTNQNILYDNNGTVGELSLASPPNIGLTTPAAGSFTTLIGGAGSANYEQITGGATTKAVQFRTLGTDTNISVAVQPKGTGAIDLAAGSQGINISNGGTVATITRTAGGTGYTIAPTVTISAPTTVGGIQATATCTVTAGVVDTTFIITNVGSGYVEQPTITFTPVSGGSGAAAYATVGAGSIIRALGATGTQALDFYTPASTSNGIPALRLRDNSGTGYFMVQNQASSAALISQGGTNDNALISANGAGSVRLTTNGTTQTEQMRVSHTASAVNYVQVTGAATGNRPTISAQGTDTNIDLALTPKGTGVVSIPTLSLTNALSVANGGTGLTSLTSGRIPYGNGTSALNSSANFTYNGTDFTLLSGDIYATNPTAAPNASSSPGKVLYSVGQIWNSGLGTKTMTGGLQVASYQANTNPTISKLSFVVGTDTNAATEKMYVTSTGLFNINGGATFAGASLDDTFNAVYIQNNAAATFNINTGAQASNKVFLQGRSWNSAAGNILTNGYLQAVTITNNANPTIESLNFAAGSGLSGVAATQYFSMTNQGRFGIGTLTPTQTLDVTNTVGARQFAVASTVSAVNYLQVTGAATATSPSISALGSDANIDLALTPKGTGSVVATSPIKLQGYTVATLPTAGSIGRTAYVTDALAPTYLGTLTGGGASKTPVFDNGTAWVSY